MCWATEKSPRELSKKISVLVAWGAVTKYQKLEGLKQEKLIFSLTVLKARSPKSGVVRDIHPKGYWDDSFLASSASPGCLHPWLAATSLQPLP